MASNQLFYSERNLQKGTWIESVSAAQTALKIYYGKGCNFLESFSKSLDIILQACPRITASVDWIRSDWKRFQMRLLIFIPDYTMEIYVGHGEHCTVQHEEGLFYRISTIDDVLTGNIVDFELYVTRKKANHANY